MATKVRRSAPEPKPEHPPWQVTVKRFGDQAVVCLEGTWRLRDRLPLAAVVLRSLTSPTPVRRVTFDTDRLDVWDTGLLTFLRNLMGEAERAGLQIDHDGLPQEVERLLALASAVPVRQAAPEPAGTRRFGRAVTSTFALWAASVEVLTFTGEICAAFAGLFTRRVRIRWFPFALLIEEVGVSALPIMTLVGSLMGIIIAFGGALQLRQLGVQIFIADVVGVSMAQEVGALIAAIVLAGRTGAAFAAQLGSMQVKEEIDALSTAGISPVQFLVLPRVLALVLMTPVLTVYADLFGIVGGGIVGVTMLDLSVTAYVVRILDVVTIGDFGMGLARASVFGVLIALAGCLRGMQAGRSASAVGLAATSAVVTSIVLVILADGFIGVVFLALRL
jgi:phospholipid/cholesterol/gamma-HCH transport system permease protein